MASGKQLSFRCGEISPEFQFNSLAPSYAEGLVKLDNGYIKSTGGVANRSGFIRLYENPMRIGPEDLPPADINFEVYDNAVAASQGAGPKITAFTFWNEFDSRYDILEIGYFDSASPDLLKYRYNFGTPTEITLRDLYGPPPTITFPHELAQMRFFLAGSRLVITPYFKMKYYLFSNIGILPNICFNLKDKTFELVSGQADRTLNASNILLEEVEGYSKGVAPWLPVSYFLTGEDSDGFEYPIAELDTPNPNPLAWDSQVAGAAPNYPHAQMYTSLSWRMVFPDGFDLESTRVRCYRAAWSAGEDKLYKMVSSGKIAKYGSEYKYILSDYGEENITITPPIDYGYTARAPQTFSYTPKGEVTDYGFLANFSVLAQANAACFHQGRLHSAIEAPPEGIFSDYPTLQTWYRPSKAEGAFLASKLNAPTQNNPPLIFSETGAFSYKIKEAQGSRALAFLPMKRLVILTSEGAFVCNGSVSGVLTPTEVNPERISNVGINALVEPKMSGRRGYYLASDSSRVMGIVWGEGAQASYNVFELSMFSSHLLQGESFIKMEALANAENSVVLLTSMGRLIHVTTRDEASLGGFSSFGLVDGYIENIFTTKMKAYYKDSYEAWKKDSGYRDVLAAYVIRNGVRRLEVLSLREDKDTLTYCYMDSAMPFGFTLIKKDGAYRRATFPAMYYDGVPASFINARKTASTGFFFPNQIEIAQFNIGHTTTTDWAAGTPIDLFCSTNIADGGGAITPDQYRLDFYYDDAEGNIRTLRGEVDLLSSVTTSGGEPLFKKMSVVFEEDVPAGLRNVTANASLTAEEKLLRMTRWNLAFKTLPAEMIPEIIARRPSHIPAGAPVPVSLYADRTLVSSPLNPQFAENTVYVDPSTGVDFGGDYFAFGFVGFPYQMRMITLPIEPSDNRTLQTGTVIVSSVTMGLHSSMDAYVGLPDQETEDMGMILVKQKDPYDFVQLPKPFSGKETVSTPSRFEDGKLEFRAVDPLPFTLLSIYPNGQSS